MHVRPANFSRFTSQCAGISPSHATPESRIGTLGSSPFVTAWLIERGALLGQQRQQPLLLGDQRVEPGGLAVEEGGDGALFGEGWQAKRHVLARCYSVPDRRVAIPLSARQ